MESSPSLHAQTRAHWDHLRFFATLPELTQKSLLLWYDAFIKYFLAYPELRPHFEPFHSVVSTESNFMIHPSSPLFSHYCWHLHNHMKHQVSGCLSIELVYATARTCEPRALEEYLARLLDDYGRLGVTRLLSLYPPSMVTFVHHLSPRIISFLRGATPDLVTFCADVLVFSYMTWATLGEMNVLDEVFFSQVTKHPEYDYWQRPNSSSVVDLDEPVAIPRLLRPNPLVTPSLVRFPPGLNPSECLDWLCDSDCSEDSSSTYFTVRTTVSAESSEPDILATPMPSPVAVTLRHLLHNLRTNLHRN